MRFSCNDNHLRKYHHVTLYSSSISRLELVLGCFGLIVNKINKKLKKFVPALNLQHIWQLVSRDSLITNRPKSGTTSLLIHEVCYSSWLFLTQSPSGHVCPLHLQLSSSSYPSWLCLPSSHPHPPSTIHHPPILPPPCNLRSVALLTHPSWLHRAPSDLSSPSSLFLSIISNPSVYSLWTVLEALCWFNLVCLFPLHISV